jgi:hypothetical protein
LRFWQAIKVTTAAESASRVLHFPKKPFVANAGGCSLSTAQVVVLAYLPHFIADEVIE